MRRWTATGARATPPSSRSARLCAGACWRSPTPARTSPACRCKGSGTFAVEAQLGTLVPRNGRLLILVGGAYGRRMVEIFRRMGRSCAVLETEESVAPTAGALARRLAAERDVTDVALVHCETTTGILNPLADLGRRGGRERPAPACRRHELVRRHPDRPWAAAAHEPRGVGQQVPRRRARRGFRHRADRSPRGMRRQRPCREPRPARPVGRPGGQPGQWRFTPPTHIVAALDRAARCAGR